MTDAESKTKKRIRHCFPRHALYHQFVHSDTYAYSPANRHQVSCIGNYLFIGIYNLRYIAYLDKKTDNGNQLGYKEWVIQIGCHSLWLDDIQNFIKYYHLENKFSINNIKIQMK